MPSKVCVTCKEEKELDNFYFDKFNKKTFSSCRTCCRSMSNKRYADNGGKEKRRERHRRNAKSVEWKNKRNLYVRLKKESLHGRFLKWRRLAKERGIEWKITESYLASLPLTCFYTGQTLSFKSNLPNTISLDRIDSSKGYIENNVAFCCWKINIAKNDLSYNEFINMCKTVHEYANR